MDEQVKRELVKITREPTEEEKWQLSKMEENLWCHQDEILDILEVFGEWFEECQSEYYELKEIFERCLPPCQRRPDKKFLGQGTDLL